MFSQRIATSIDYNRGLHPPIRWVHVAWAAIVPVVDILFGWTRHPRAREWAPLVLFTLAAVLILLPQDVAITQATKASFESLGNDIQRELAALQQYGQGLFIILTSITIYALDTERRARLLDWGMGALIALGATNLLNVVFARPRPSLNDPFRFLGPLGTYALDRVGGARIESVWTTGYEFESMPSRHAAYAILASVFLATLYPKLRGLVFMVAVLVCITRVATGAHYPTDVIAGAAVGLLIARYAIGHRWGQRAVQGIIDALDRRRAARQARLQPSAQHTGLSPSGLGL